MDYQIITDEVYNKIEADLTHSSGKIAQDESQNRLKEILNLIENELGCNIRDRIDIAPKKGRPQGKQITINNIFDPKG